MEPFFSYERGRGLDFKGFFTSKDCCFWCCLLENHLKIIGCIFRFHGQSENQTMFTDLSLPCSDLVRFKLSYKAIRIQVCANKGINPTFLLKMGGLEPYIYYLKGRGLHSQGLFTSKDSLFLFVVVVHLDTPRKFKTDTKKDWCCVLILTSLFRRVFYIFWIYPPTQDTSGTWRFWLGSRTLLFFCHPGGDCCWFGGRFKAYWWTGLKRMKSKYVLNGSRHVENGRTTN